MTRPGRWMMSGMVLLTAACAGEAEVREPQCSRDEDCTSLCPTAVCFKARCTCPTAEDVPPADEGAPVEDVAAAPDPGSGDAPEIVDAAEDLPAPDLVSPDVPAVDVPPPDEGPGDVTPAPCPPDMVHVAQGGFCIDRYEAPNVEGGLPLVMYHFYESEDWCAARGKRLCLDTEWQLACEGPDQTTYPYGDAHEPGVCNDEEVWIVYSQTKLSGWPSNASEPDIGSLDELLDRAASISAAGAVAAEHIAELYQGEPGGANTGCGGAFGVYDLVGNVEEWTRRADGGDGPDFLGRLKGRYWAESRTCQQGVASHGNAFRFYEIGFRCCLDPAVPAAP